MFRIAYKQKNLTTKNEIQQQSNFTCFFNKKFNKFKIILNGSFTQTCAKKKTRKKLLTEQALKRIIIFMA